MSIPQASAAIGLIGGIGPESTIEYYRRLVAGWGRRTARRGAPSIVIVSVDLATVVAALAERRHEDLVDYLAAGLQRLARAGASVAGFAANSVHAAFEPLAARSPLRLVSIVEATAAAASRSGFRTLGLMGARFTTAGGFYAPVFERGGMTVRAPSEPDRDWIHDAYMNELVAGIVREATRARMTDFIRPWREQDGIDAVILGGTELSLLFREPEAGGVPLLDTTQIHVEALLDAIGEKETP